MYVLVTNIPEQLRTPDLRNFFSEVIENEIFDCFHFRHRPHKNFLELLSKKMEDEFQCSRQETEVEVSDNNDLCKSSEENTNDLRSLKFSGLSSLIKEMKRSTGTQDYTNESQSSQTEEKGNTGIGSSECSSEIQNSVLDSAKGTCCIVNVKEEFSEKFSSLYHQKYWVDRNGDILPMQCLILKLDDTYFSENQVGDVEEKDYLTREEYKRLGFDALDVEKMIEFNPPSVMPQGNIGTPTLHFKNLIRSCELPATIISKLGLEFPRSRGKKRFSQVAFDYGTEVYSGKANTHKNFIAFTAKGHHIPSSVDFKKPINKRKKSSRISKPKLELENEQEDGAEVEEWERYEAFHNDVTSQDRTKERLYEKDIELTWEKGGPGLVFYTDAQYWREQEGDFDEQTADEWDVDMSIFYEKGAGDFDAKSRVAMIESNDLRSGALTQSAFKKSAEQNLKVKRKKRGPTLPPKIGTFEAHTRGFGRRLLESQGWKDGLGLGRQKDGRAYAVENDGQHPHDKKGFGYYGEKFQGWGESSSSLARQERCRSFRDEAEDDGRIRISTVFDNPKQVDPPATHLRTSEPTRLSHRKKDIVFCKGPDMSFS